MTNIAKEGYPFVGGFLAAGVFLFLWHNRLADAVGWISFIGAAFCVYFFRDPQRNPQDDQRFVLSPGDGRVLAVAEENHPFFPAKVKVIRIFLSIFDVHVQHAPISGKVAKIEYRRGKFLDARDPKAAFENESNSIYIEGESKKVVVRQIAGLIARRIACQVKVGETVRIGQKLGMIRFGSQVNLYVDSELEVCVAAGDRVTSGVSVVAMDKKAIAPPKTSQ